MESTENTVRQSEQKPPVFYPIAPPAKERQPRRVGTLTMGAALVAFGSALLAGQIWGFEITLTMLRWSPLVLVLLGLEVLLTACFSQGAKLRYDFLSTLVCLMLVGGSLIGSAIPLVMQVEGKYEQLRYTASRQLETQLSAKLEEGSIAGVEVDVYPWDHELAFLSMAESPEEMLASGHYTCNVSVELGGSFETVEDFAAAAANTAKSAGEILTHPDAWMVVTGWRADGERYRLEMDNWKAQLPVEELAWRVEGPQENAEEPNVETVS